MLGERSGQKGLWDADHFFLYPDGPKHIASSADIMAGTTVLQGCF